MFVRFLGACREVGRSCILLETNETKILLDCGVDVSGNKEPIIDDVKIDAIVITHAHLDHAGFVPRLVRDGFKGKIILTKPTRDLLQVLWSDFLKIAKESGREPYTQEDIRKSLKMCCFVEYGEKVKVKDLRITIEDASHVLGSAQVKVELPNKKTVLYTGDINNRSTRLHSGCKVDKSDVLIMETTYGGSEDNIPSIKKTGREIADTIKNTVANGGTVLIPVFSVGRAQEVLLTIDAYLKTKYIPNVPVFIDGMVKKTCRIYRVNAIYLKEEIWKRILMSEENPFMPNYVRIPRTKDKKDVLEHKPSIIIAPSGMLTGGPSLQYFEEIKDCEENCVLFVGYQAENTLGRALIEGSANVKCKVAHIRMSAHADRKGLEDILKQASPETCFLVHGEGEKMKDFSKFSENICNTIVPNLGEEYEL